jgi:hypothetical protein
LRGRIKELRIVNDKQSKENPSASVLQAGLIMSIKGPQGRAMAVF